MKNLSDSELLKLCEVFGRNAMFFRRKFEALLPEVNRRKLFKKKKCHSIFEFAAKFGGVGRKTVEEILRINEKIEGKPLLKAAMEEHGVWKVRAAVRVDASEEVQLNMVETMPKQAIEEFAKEQKLEKELTEEANNNSDTSHFPPGWEMTGSDFVSLNFRVDKDTEFRLRLFKKKLEKERRETVSFNDVLKALLAKTEPKFTPRPTRARVTVSTTRYIPSSVKRELSEKCSFPACNRPADFRHHPDRFALTKNHDRLTPLCKIHHQIAHAGLIQNENEPANRWRLCNKPDKTDPKFKIDQKMLKFQFAR